MSISMELTLRVSASIQYGHSDANTSALTGSAARFKPLTSDLKELGIKAQLFSRISLNLAVYEVNQRNIIINANNPSEPDELIQRGADRSRGFEAEFSDTSFLNGIFTEATVILMLKYWMIPTLILWGKEREYF
ncbi:TonB-dependent receptor [Chryseobacterium arthrosphaerae]|uniref:TonB-dependent receptor n=1 Tax=Chryseobacterium arthrosphaerae TaxID=651561 RepID=A0A3S0N544_9FLAO|nr:TonB-dependent receptor [Chryseobacterium arthrosphaerae]